AAFAIEADGKLSETPVVVQHAGSSVDPERQKGPHAHAVVLSADNRFLFVPDLGLDQIMIYQLDPAKPALTKNEQPFIKLEGGFGPRHFALHPKAGFAYGLNEMKSSVTTFFYDPKHGALKAMQTVSTLPEDFKGQNSSAEIEVDAKGRFLYTSNRGHDSIAVFAIGKDGQLTLLENVPTKGKTPRSFKIDPTGSFLLAANQN